MPDSQPITKATFRSELDRLIRNFAANEPEYTSPGYPEAQARTDFITPFFRALGWDVENRAGLPYTQREVIEEKGPGPEPSGRPDYTFRIAGTPKFFVEAKAPHEDLDAERHVLQAKRYAWSTKEVFAVILTDFEEFRFYDASLEPDPNHPHRGLLDRFHLRYTEYLDNLDKLWEFSPVRVAAGAIEALLPRDRLSLRHRKPPDDKFLEDMTRWREELARAVFKRNPGLDPSALTEIVQRLLDRIIFIRVAEDRHIILYRTLWERVQEWLAIGKRKPLLPMLNDLFHEVNEDFNGDIFRYHHCEEIQLDDWALGRIIEELYPPRGPYRFDAIPVDIFGAVYERYLGKTIYPKGKQVVVEDKPEVRKAGGVYYTPKYIVDYIVRNTVGKLIEGKTPKEIEKIRILDPACGSGSFLIGAFQCLIDYHVRYYEKHPKEAYVHPLYPELMPISANPQNALSPVAPATGAHRLAIHRKAKILHNNLFGVDLDPQAVEITMMNLYLKALEGERHLPQKQQLLPELKFNIRCGNSLIAPDIAQPSTELRLARAKVEGQEQKLSPEEIERLRPFDWHSKTDGFGHIMESGGETPARLGGFHAVIGNPPYVRQEELSDLKDYFKSHYASFHGLADLYVYFLEKDVKALAHRGRLGIIVSSSFLRTHFAHPLRAFLKDSVAVLRIVDFGGLPVFEDAKDTYVCVPLFAKEKQPDRVEVCKVESLRFDDLDRYVSNKLFTIPHGRLTPEAWSLKSDVETGLFKKISGRGTPLGKYVGGKMFYGLKTGLNEAFELSDLQRRSIVSQSPRSAAIIKPVLGGEDIKRYHIEYEREFWVVIPSGWTREQIAANKKKSRVLSQKEAWEWFRRSYRALARHLESSAPALQKRTDQGEFWWELRPCDYYQHFEMAKIIFPDICKGPRFCLDVDGYYLKNTAYCLGTGDAYLLGVLNSRLFWFMISSISIPFGIRAGEYRYRLIYQYMEKVPIRVVDSSDATDKARHDKMVALVERMLELNKKKHSGKLAASELDRVDREITSTDRQIDQLVYQLYGLTPEEIALVERSVKGPREFEQSPD